MKLTKEIKQAIREAIERHGTAIELSRVTGIKQQNFSRYLSGEIKNITIETWQKLQPELNISDSNNLITNKFHCTITARNHCPLAGNDILANLVRDIMKLDKIGMLKAHLIIEEQLTQKHTTTDGGLETAKTA
jgi:DNA-binding Xre family transcriptional regulator